MTGEDEFVGRERVESGDDVGEGLCASVGDPLAESVFRHCPIRRFHAARDQVLHHRVIS